MLQSSETRVRNLLAAAEIEVNGPNPFDPQVNDPSVYDRMMAGGTLAIGEAYMDGAWDCEQIDVFVDKVGSLGSPIRYLGKWSTAKAVAHNAFRNMQQLGQAAENASHHYSIGNDLYEAQLGKTMAYSCAYWERFGGPAANGAVTLDTAQEAKFDLICQKLRLQPGMRVLEIGCGWGGFLAHAVRTYGVEAVGVTPVKEQVDHIRESESPIDVRQQDWREIDDETFDRVVSVGMFEHVGPKNYRSYFAKVRQLLSPEGLYLHHTIGAPRTRYMVDPWINKYIFPGGHIPSEAQIRRASRGHLEVADWHQMGRNYDPTLMAWNENFQAAWPELRKARQEDGSLRYDERFKRMWEYYLLSCAGSFRNQSNLLFQVVMGSPQAIAGYEAVR